MSRGDGANDQACLTRVDVADDDLWALICSAIDRCGDLSTEGTPCLLPRNHVTVIGEGWHRGLGSFWSPKRDGAL